MKPTKAPYDGIAEWYDQHAHGPIYDEIVLPNVLALAGEVRDSRILDIACGQGVVARELARVGAKVTGVDLSEKLLSIARRYEDREPLGVVYLHDDAESLAQLETGTFDGAVCIMALMDIADPAAALQASRRVLRAGGWLVIAMTHPCFEVPDGRWVTREDGRPAREVTGYFSEGFWRSSNPEGVRGQVGAYHRTLGTYINAFAGAGYCIERMVEPSATPQRALQVPGNREVPSFMLLRLRAV